MAFKVDPWQFSPLIFLLQILATALMTGIIWFVQIVHYPLFAKIPREGFTAYERSHTVRTGWVVAPLMLVELGSAVALLLPPLFGVPALSLALDPLYLTALGCLILIWASTFLLQVPLHYILEQRPDSRSMDRLVTTNWIRTFLWTVRLVLLGVLASRFVTL